MPPSRIRSSRRGTAIHIGVVVGEFDLAVVSDLELFAVVRPAVGAVRNWRPVIDSLATSAPTSGVDATRAASRAASARLASASAGNAPGVDAKM